MPRQTYHHGDLRTALIDAAITLLEAHGAAQVSMREAARIAGVSAGAPYRHFKDRDELMSAVAAAGHRRMMAHLEAATEGNDGAMARYRSHGVGVVTFAVAHPHLFRVMNTALWARAAASPEMAAVAEALNTQTASLVAEAQQAGELTPGSPAVVMLAAESLVYGLARLFVDGRMAELGVESDQAEAVANAVVDLFGVGLVPRTGSAVQER